MKFQSNAVRRFQQHSKDKTKYIQDEITKLSQYNSKLIPSIFQDNKAATLEGRTNVISTLGRSGTDPELRYGFQQSKHFQKSFQCFADDSSWKRCRNNPGGSNPSESTFW